MAPLGKKTKAVRSGMPVAVVASLPPAAVSAAKSSKGFNDEKSGKATQAPTPRKKWRRLRPASPWVL